MSISNVKNLASTALHLVQSSPPPQLKQSSGAFASALTSASNQTGHSDAEVKKFFASNPSKQQIADQAVALRLNESQVMQAMQIGGFHGSTSANLKAEIDSYVGSPSNGYSWGTNGVLVSSKPGMGRETAATDKVLPAEAEMKAFYATNPTPEQITAKAKAQGLNPAQFVQAEVARQGMNMSQVCSHVLETMYVDAAQRLGVDVGPQGAWNSYFSPSLGRAISATEIQSFFSTAPSQAQIFRQASEWGLGLGAVTNMTRALGIPQSDAAYGSLNNKMHASLFLGSGGYSLDRYDRIVAGGGHQLVNNSDGSGTWVPKAAGTALVATA